MAFSGNFGDMFPDMHYYVDKRNPDGMNLEIRSEIRRYIDDGPRTLWELAEESGGAVVYVCDRKTGGKREQGGKELSVSVLAGNPLLIALYNGQYEVARRLLDKNPKLTASGYAALPADLALNGSTLVNDGKLEFYKDQGIYLEELVLTDPNIPDDLFLKLWESLWGTYDREHADLPALITGYPYLQGKGTPVPAFIQNWPCRMGLRISYGELNYIDYCWQELEHTREEMKEFRDAAQKDIDLWWKAMKGLVRAKKLDKDFDTKLNGKMQGHLLLKFTCLLFTLIDGEWGWNADVMKGDCDDIWKVLPGAEEMERKLRADFKKLGFLNLTADEIWDACMEYENHFSIRTYGYYFAFWLWRRLTGKEIVLTAEPDRLERTSELVGALLGMKKISFAPNKVHGRIPITPINFEIDDEVSKKWLDLVKGVVWKDCEGSLRFEEKLQEELQGMLELVFGKEDKEFLWICLEKNLFPRELMDSFYEQLSGKGWTNVPGMLAMLIMGKHLGNFCPI